MVQWKMQSLEKSSSIKDRKRTKGNIPIVTPLAIKSLQQPKIAIA